MSLWPILLLAAGLAALAVWNAAAKCNGTSEAVLKEYANLLEEARRAKAQSLARAREAEQES